MNFIADFHLHSKYSRSTSKQMDLENIYQYGKIKGIQVIGTGDFTHPAWFSELKEKLEPCENGLFALKPAIAKKINKKLPAIIRKQKLRFILTAEISNIYSKAGQVRKMHNLIIAPDFKTVAKINTKLSSIGNLSSDGRPILGLDSKKLLQITYQANQRAFFIPAHIWTPWFSMFGSKSGFDTIEQAFDQETPKITAIETGLSSDPYMNWRLSQLKHISIISNSDAHSPLKLGREANLFNCPLDYDQIIQALQTNDQRLVGTIEFFPQEGKYHYDGHRSCNICFSSVQTKKHQGVCPVCQRPVVVGVDNRVNELADHPPTYQPKNHKKVEYIIPLLEIIAELNQVKTIGKKVLEQYQNLYSNLGSEFAILRQVPIDQIKAAGFQTLAAGIERLRLGKVSIQPGYDGVYGIIKVFANNKQLKSSTGQASLL
ncbi:MAG: hypothetical protein GF332_00200 [Candidatus Moranbacteria bacterium]|nr:hypothetical protein [Candidatus Moranbacteria bacterium]